MTERAEEDTEFHCCQDKRSLDVEIAERLYKLLAQARDFLGCCARVTYERSGPWIARPYQ